MPKKLFNLFQNEINLKKLKNKEFANGFKNSQNLSNIKKDVIKKLNKLTFLLLNLIY